MVCFFCFLPFQRSPGFWASLALATSRVDMGLLSGNFASFAKLSFIRDDLDLSHDVRTLPS